VASSVQRARRTVLVLHIDDPEKPLPPFIQHDIDILRTEYQVEVLSVYRYRHDLLRLFLDITSWRALLKADALFVWFNFSTSVVAVAALLGKPVVVVAGGADVVWVSDIGYGIDPARRRAFWLRRMAYRLTRKVLLFSESSRRDYLKIFGVDPLKSETCYLGVDSHAFTPRGAKRPHVFTVSYVSENSLRRKGVYSLIDTARLTPDIQYRIAGVVVDAGAVRRLRASASPNVEFLGELTREQLLAEYRSAKVYAQLSYHEGFGMALAEAMACECVPVVTDRGSLPELVGSTGFYVPVGDAGASASAIREALADDGSRGVSARERIVQCFPLEARKEGVLRALEEVLGV